MNVADNSQNERLPLIEIKGLVKRFGSLLVLDGIDETIYKGEKVAFIGSFVLFMQSPAGWLCMLLVLGSVIITPIAENKINKVKKLRLSEILPPEELAEEFSKTEKEEKVKKKEETSPLKETEVEDEN